MQRSNPNPKFLSGSLEFRGLFVCLFVCPGCSGKVLEGLKSKKRKQNELTNDVSATVVELNIINS